MHLTCTNMPVEKLDNALDTVKSNGIQNILALRGDPPHGQDKFVQVSGGFSCALDLVSYSLTQLESDDLIGGLFPLSQRVPDGSFFAGLFHMYRCSEILTHFRNHPRDERCSYIIRICHMLPR